MHSHRPKLVATCLKMTSAQQVAYTAALTTEAGGDSWKISSSCSSVDKSVVELQGTLRQNTELSGLLRSCSQYTGTQSICQRCTTFLGQGPQCNLFGALEGRRQNYELNIRESSVINQTLFYSTLFLLLVV